MAMATAFCVIAIGCVTAPNDGGASDGDATMTAEEAACANVTARCEADADASAACVEGLVTRRESTAGSGCDVEYDAWVACIQGLTTCPAESILCPEEYSEFGRCVAR